MTPENHDRIHRATKIAKKPWLFHLCLGCGSIIGRNNGICPACRHYHFDERECAVIAAAAEMAQRAGTEDENAGIDS